MFRLLTFTIIMLSIVEIFCREDWKEMNSPTTNVLKKVFFIDSSNGWACGSEGTIIHTSDAGNSWVIQDSQVETFITDIFFLNNNYGWALTQRNFSPFGTTILKTTNSGNEWSPEDYFENNVFMNTVFFFDSLNGYLGGTYIAKTTNGGTSWIKANVDSQIISILPVHNFNFYNRQTGYACGGALDFAGVIWKTTDSGLNWIASGVSADQVFDVFIKDSANLMALSGDPEGIHNTRVIKTSDGGESWNFEDLMMYGLSFSLEFRTETEGWSASGSKFIYTTDTGDTWLEKVTPDSSVIYDLQFVNSQSGYAVGENGIILKFVPPPVSVKENPPTIKLYQNYPNPFNPTTKIRYTIPTSPQSPPYQGGEAKRGWFVRLTVYDVLGNEIATLVDEYKSEGSYDVAFNAANLSSGVYFYTLTTGTFCQTKKMILLK